MGTAFFDDKPAASTQKTGVSSDSMSNSLARSVNSGMPLQLMSEEMQLLLVSTDLFSSSRSARRAGVFFHSSTIPKKRDRYGAMAIICTYISLLMMVRSTSRIDTWHASSSVGALIKANSSNRKLSMDGEQRVLIACRKCRQMLMDAVSLMQFTKFSTSW